VRRDRNQSQPPQPHNRTRNLSSVEETWSSVVDAISEKVSTLKQQWDDNVKPNDKNKFEPKLPDHPKVVVDVDTQTTDEDIADEMTAEAPIIMQSYPVNEEEEDEFQNDFEESDEEDDEESPREEEESRFVQASKFQGRGNHSHNHRRHHRPQHHGRCHWVHWLKSYIVFYHVTSVVMLLAYLALFRRFKKNLWWRENRRNIR
jgi:hypothetical protein